MTKKEWLKKVHGIGNGNGRGRISLEGHRLIAEAAAQGVTWDEPASVVAAAAARKTTKVKPKSSTPAKPEITEEYNPAEVRKWARDNGKTVSARGRIDSVIVQAYLDAVPKAERVERDDSMKDLRPSAPRRFPEGTTFTVNFTDTKGKSQTRVMNDRTACMGCGVSLAFCSCPTLGPVALGYDDQSKPQSVEANLPTGA